ncbi:HD domain-containing phosphohydrolase [Mesorhizobium sp. NZP2077]|uniref:HD domain-containing phosphohydrolase n=1 Tax=Mesorhizobium sp. NZP2077 TaxID=2483404 RepID=UPI0015552C85|nr:HD domain-containing phosphohydrolase [Mesorhizobium sp. NZP2077]QKC84774.1 response regulator [Mesorhizobium sp. NZP2077]QKD18368.1 response regulator [Mesorhizobium sp. NZP2077]
MDGAIRILIVEDNRTSRMLMEMLVGQIPNCVAISYSAPVDVLRDLPTIAFDLGIVDYQMPGIDGIELIERIRSERRFADTPFVMVTADGDAGTRIDAIHAGATEFLHKPVEPVEFKARMRNLVRLCEAQRDLVHRAEWLKVEVDKATQELREREEEIIRRLTLAAGYKDRETAMHTIRMAHYSSVLARHLGFSADQCRDILLAAPMHDIGKVGISDSILLKQEQLSAAEKLRMNEHTRIGGAILAGSTCALLQLAAKIAETHHERWDGTGYPNGLRGESIPLVGRIAAVADVFDALTSDRTYKDAWPVDRAFAYIREQSGAQFDPECVRALQAASEEFLDVKAAYPDDPAERRYVA